MYESKNNKIADLVFIHGFVLNYIETWTNVDQSSKIFFLLIFFNIKSFLVK